MNKNRIDTEKNKKYFTIFYFSMNLSTVFSKGELEIGIVSFPIKEENLEIERNIFHTMKYDASILMMDDHPLASKKPLNLKDLKDDTFSSMSKDYVL